MDIISHGLWGGAYFVKKSKKSFWTAFTFGVLPDLTAFGWFFISYILQNGFKRPYFIQFEPPRDWIPQYVHTIYNFSHSLIIFGVIFLIVWAFRKKPLWEMSAWVLHILMDIPSHTNHFFLTPFIYPLSSYRFSGISWANPVFLL